jgi:hypothetical protein
MYLRVVRDELVPERGAHLLGEGALGAVEPSRSADLVHRERHIEPVCREEDGALATVQARVSREIRPLVLHRERADPVRRAFVHAHSLIECVGAAGFCLQYRRLGIGKREERVDDLRDGPSMCLARDTECGSLRDGEGEDTEEDIGLALSILRRRREERDLTGRVSTPG